MHINYARITFSMHTAEIADLSTGYSQDHAKIIKVDGYIFRLAMLLFSIFYLDPYSKLKAGVKSSHNLPKYQIKLLTSKLLSQGNHRTKPVSTLKKFYGTQ